MKHNQKVCVLGLGYIGLPTASLLATKGFDVVGVDVNPKIVDSLNAGEVIIQEPSLDILVKSAVQSGCLRAQLAPAAADIYIIAVPTPFGPGHKPDLTYVQQATERLALELRPGNLVILESTSPVGTTEKVAAWIKGRRPDLAVSERGGATPAAARPVHVAHCPERVLPGQILRELVENDRIVGGIDAPSTEAAAEFYKTFVAGAILLTDSRTAEMSKLTENIYRDVNIALANELSVICDEMGIDVWTLISLANRHPRVNILSPGPGVGGHCIAVDPWFVVDAVPKLAKLMRAAREVNDAKPAFVLEKVKSAIAGQKAPVVACLGLSYKANVDDLRESPSVAIVGELAKIPGLKLLVVEPHVEALPEKLTAPNVRLVSLAEALRGANVLLLLVDHTVFQAIEPAVLREKVLVDTRGVWRELSRK